jgi:predicted RNase H-like HicB family nuclease
MTTARYVYWRDGNYWLGYFEDFPDYLTQGESLEISRITSRTCTTT